MFNKIFKNKFYNKFRNIRLLSLKIFLSVFFITLISQGCTQLKDTIIDNTVVVPTSARNRLIVPYLKAIPSSSIFTKFALFGDFIIDSSVQTC